MHALTAFMLTDVSDYTGAYLISVYLFTPPEDNKVELAKALDD